MILHHLSSGPEIIWVLATHRKLHQSTGSLGCLSRGSHLAPESDYLLGSKKRKMSQRIQCVVNNRERHADCMRIKMQINAIVFSYGLDTLCTERRYALTDSQTASQRICHMPFSPPWEEREAGVWGAGRQAEGKAEQAVSCGYLVCFGTELSGSRRG